MTWINDTMGWVIAHPIGASILTAYTVLVIWQIMRIRKPKVSAEGLVEVFSAGGAKAVYQVARTEVKKPPPKGYKGGKLPLVVFESRVLEETLPTLCYNHLGYGASSAPGKNDSRDSIVLAKDLYDLLNSLNLIGELKDGFPPLILVGHSFGGLAVRAFAAAHHPPNLIGIVLADSLPLTLLKDYPQLEDFLTTRLPRVLKTASSLAEMGFMHILSFFGVSMIPAGGKMAVKLSASQLKGVRYASCDPDSLMAMKREVEGIKNSLPVIETLERQRKALKGIPALAVAAVTVENVDKPWTDVKVTYDIWKAKWREYQTEISKLNEDKLLKAASGDNGTLFVDADSDHVSLCTSHSVIEAIASIATSFDMKNVASKTASTAAPCRARASTAAYSAAAAASTPQRPQRTSTEPGILGRPSNNLKMGIVGLPNVGKSCLFNALTSSSVPSENYPFCTIDPTESRALVPDERFRWLVDCYKPKGEVAAFLTVVDIAGLVRGAAQGEGLGNNFLSNIKATDGIFHLVRSFSNPGIVHVEGAIDPVRDIDIIRTELRLKDSEQISALLKKKVKGHDPKNSGTSEKDLLEYINHMLLNKDIDVRMLDWNKDEAEVLNRLQLLSAKPVAYLVNLSEQDAVTGENEGLAAVRSKVASEKTSDLVIGFSGEFEEYLACLQPEERAETLASVAKMYGVKEARSVLSDIIWAGYKAMNLMHYFTCGEQEVRAWTIRSGIKAPLAASVIHSDFEKNFIAAEVFKYHDILELGTEAAVKTAGRVMTRGKDSQIEDGDIVYFKLRR
ncbi:hypothetical protein HDU67_004888 [Dinochytrium kinnereticum]|nr:hypothetical protein HDU67_004888 [Dinochytrium kinnereticum]